MKVTDRTLSYVPSPRDRSNLMVIPDPRRNQMFVEVQLTIKGDGAQ